MDQNISCSEFLGFCCLRRHQKEISSAKNDASNLSTSGCNLTIRSAALCSFLMFQCVRDDECDTQTLLCGFWEPAFKKKNLHTRCNSGGLGHNSIEWISLSMFLFCHAQLGQMFFDMTGLVSDFNSPADLVVSDCSSREERFSTNMLQMEKVLVEELLSQKPLEFMEQTLILILHCGA